MKEIAEFFGANARLLGVLTRPESSDLRPCLVILNAGFIHRVGPGRVAVDLARRVARAGFPAFRLDISGTGDSAPPLPAPRGAIPAIADVREALDHLGAKHGVSRFVVAGLCSGAINAHHAVAADERLVGAILLDAYVYATTRSRLLLAGELAVSPRRMIRGALRRAGRLFKRRVSEVEILPGEEGFLPWTPAKSDAARDLVRVRDRGVPLLYVYSGEWSRRYRYEGQLRDAFQDVQLGDLLTEKLIPSADHVFLTRSSRESLLSTIVDWLEREFPAGGKPR